MKVSRSLRSARPWCSPCCGFLHLGELAIRAVQRALLAVGWVILEELLEQWRAQLASTRGVVEAAVARSSIGAGLRWYGFAGLIGRGEAERAMLASPRGALAQLEDELFVGAEDERLGEGVDGDMRRGRRALVVQPLRGSSSSVSLRSHVLALARAVIGHRGVHDDVADSSCRGGGPAT
jgi:hypothetical protein